MHIIGVTAAVFLFFLQEAKALKGSFGSPQACRLVLLRQGPGLGTTSAPSHAGVFGLLSVFCRFGCSFELCSLIYPTIGAVAFPYKSLRLGPGENHSWLRGEW